MFRCPRCQAEECAADLLPHQKTLAAVAVDSVRQPGATAGFVAATLEAPQPASAAPVVQVAVPPVKPSAEQASAVVSTDAAGVEVSPASPDSLLLRAIRMVLGAAERFDAFSYGYRDTVLYVLSGAYCLCVLVSAVSGVPIWERVALAVFFLVLGIFGLARLALFRGEDGRWTWKSATHGLLGGWGRARDWFADWRDLPPEARRASWTTLFVMGGCLTIAVRGGFEWMLAPKNSPAFTVWGFVGWAAIAFGLYRWYKFRSPRAPRAKELPAPKALCARTTGLPPVLDLVRHREVSLQHARAGADDYLFSLLAVLAEWKPRPRGEASELDYQDSLHRHLRKRAPELRVERERPLEALVEGCRHRSESA